MNSFATDRMNIQMENSQIIHKNRVLICTKYPGSPLSSIIATKEAIIYNKELRKCYL